MKTTRPRCLYVQLHVATLLSSCSDNQLAALLFHCRQYGNLSAPLRDHRLPTTSFRRQLKNLRASLQRLWLLNSWLWKRANINFITTKEGKMNCVNSVQNECTHFQWSLNQIHNHLRTFLPRDARIVQSVVLPYTLQWLHIYLCSCSPDMWCVLFIYLFFLF